MTTNPDILYAQDYLKSGGLGEVEGMARLSLDLGSERVACDTATAIALCMLAEEGINAATALDRRQAELLEANNRYLERARTAEAEVARLQKIVDGCDWYWPEDDTSSESCSDYPFEILSNWETEPGAVVAISRGGVVETRYYAQLPPAEDADSDDEFEVNEATEEDAKRKVADELARRAGQPECIACERQMHAGDRYLPDVNGVQCAECAPTYQALIDDNDGFVDSDENARTPEQCREEFEAHIVA
ncbi:MAG TPA: hypothetical protein VGN75_09015, partial [Kaistia sp.]|nr:hypothetical protein [Kaistia sp.]